VLGWGDIGAVRACTLLEFSLQVLMNKGRVTCLSSIRDVEGVCDSMHLGSRWKKAFTLSSYCIAVRNLQAI